MGQMDQQIRMGLMDHGLRLVTHGPIYHHYPGAFIFVTSVIRLNVDSRNVDERNAHENLSVLGHVEYRKSYH